MRKRRGRDDRRHATPAVNRRRLRVEFLPPAARHAARSIKPRGGLTAALIAALCGTIAGTAGALLTGKAGEASASHATQLDLREAPIAGSFGTRSKVIAALADINAGERLSPPVVSFAPAPPAAGAAPKLIIIIDDLGLDQSAFDEIMAMPGPVTLSFLPYGRHLQDSVDRAQARGDDVLLHLPMEPSGHADSGPHSLKAGMNSDALFDALEWNLSRFTGYIGVNNHMGSKFTRDEQGMKRVLAYLDQRHLFFIDSLTTGASVALDAGASVGADVLVRDVFLDAEPGEEFVMRQLKLAEKIAVETGYAIVICHPRRATLDKIGPWLTTAPSRGFELATVSTLFPPPPAAKTADAAPINRL